MSRVLGARDKNNLVLRSLIPCSTSHKSSFLPYVPCIWAHCTNDTILCYCIGLMCLVVCYITAMPQYSTGFAANLTHCERKNVDDSNFSSAIIDCLFRADCAKKPKLDKQLKQSSFKAEINSNAYCCHWRSALITCFKQWKDPKPKILLPSDLSQSTCVPSYNYQFQNTRNRFFFFRM